MVLLPLTLLETVGPSSVVLLSRQRLNSTSRLPIPCLLSHGSLLDTASLDLLRALRTLGPFAPLGRNAGLLVSLGVNAGLAALWAKLLLFHLDVEALAAAWNSRERTVRGQSLDAPLTGGCPSD